MEEKKIIKLPESELEIMQGIWVLNEEGEKFVSASLVMKRFPALQRLKLTTVLTLITRLQTKGFIKTEKIGRSNCYTPLIPSDEYRRFATGDYVKKVYLGDKMDLISTLVSDETLTAEELAEIKAVIAKNEENK
ncbi:MAG: BlaI/MecI/CopY family transcriptional regulator [Clostridia bacterium]|nr:BlaI/MecI/CopY family transcriptional regulator [Clostridia bacterium]